MTLEQLLAKAEELHNKADYEGALKFYEESITLDPENAITWYNRGVSLGKLGRSEDALDSYDKSIEFGPENAATWYNRGIVLKALGRPEDALESYDESIGLDPEDADTWNNRGLVLNDLGRSEDALESYDKSIRLDPKNAITWYNRGIVLKALGRPEEALDSYEHSIRLDPEDAIAWCNRGNALSDLGRPEEALKSYDKSVRLDPEQASTWGSRGCALNDLGQPEEALKSYDKLIRLKPEDVKTWYNRGVILADLGRLDDALESYAKCIRLDPEDAEAWCNRGSVLDSLGRPEEALESYDESIKFDPEGAIAWCNRGVVLNSLGRPEEALESCNECIRFEPEHAIAWNNRGNGLRALGRSEEALESYDECIRLNPEASYPWYGKSLIASSYEDQTLFLRRTVLLGVEPFMVTKIVEILWTNIPHPLLIAQLAHGAPGALLNEAFTSALTEVHIRYARELELYQLLQGDIETMAEGRLGVLGLLQLRYGDIIGTDVTFDELDTRFESNLLGQYYFWIFHKSVAAGDAPLAMILKEAQEHARKALEMEALDPDQRCYAGLIFQAAGLVDEAAQAWEGNTDHLRSLYLLLELRDTQGDEAGRDELIPMILREEANRVTTGLPVYLDGQPTIEALDDSQPGWEHSLLFCLQYKEVADAAGTLHRVWKNDPTNLAWDRPEFKCLIGMKHGPADLTVVRGFSRAMRNRFEERAKKRLEHEVAAAEAQVRRQMHTLDALLTDSPNLDAEIADALEGLKTEHSRLVLLNYMRLSRRITETQFLILLSWVGHISGRSVSKETLQRLFEAIANMVFSTALGHLYGNICGALGGLVTGEAVHQIVDAVKDKVKFSSELSYPEFRDEMHETIRKNVAKN